MEAYYDQFIGHYPKAVNAETCNQIINYFEEMSSIQRNYNRQIDGTPQTMKKDDAVDVVSPVFRDGHLGSAILTNQDPCTHVVRDILNECSDHYVNEYDILKGFKLWATYHKVQKTLPGGGYHIWHCEQGNGAFMRRVLVYTIYLNDVEEGGETEFLYQSKRYSARQGDICIFPAHFTHPHRGNPPLSGEKYIMTGWVDSVEMG